MLDMIIYNPFTWVISLLFFGCVFSYVYWYCKRNFELKGSWKHLDKSIHWRRQYMLFDIMLLIVFIPLLAFVTIYVGDKL